MSASRQIREALWHVPIYLGIAIAIIMHVRNGWWLDAGDRVRDMMIVLLVAAILIALRRSRGTLELWAGFMVGMTTILGTLGWGNLFPIVIAVGAANSGVAVVVGWLLGRRLVSLVDLIRRKRTHHPGNK